MQPRIFLGLLLPVLTGAILSATVPAARADDSYPFSGKPDVAVEGRVQRVWYESDRVTLAGDDGRFYTADTYNSDIVLRPVGHTERYGQLDDLRRGMRVRVVGTLLGRALVEAQTLRIISPTPAPLPVAAPTEGRDITTEGLVRLVDGERGRVTVLTDDDRRFTATTRGADIILPDTSRAGVTADLTRGMRVRLIGTLDGDGVIAADRVRVIPDGALPVAAAFPPVPVPVPQTFPARPAPVLPTTISDPTADLPLSFDDLDSYTGVLIDARHLPSIMRSPSPSLLGADGALLYPDRAHVPTPDEVQDESIVRYYRSLGAAKEGVCGDNPLIIHAVTVIGPAHDGLQLSARDAARLMELEKLLHFTRTWKVGFLIPADQ